MKLHEYKEDFKELISIVARVKQLPETAIERDYYIVLLLKNLANSEYADKCVFKGGTSLSKCYPGSIERFSEDIDLTYLGMGLNDKACDKTIKQIEKIITVGAETEKINTERSNRSKSMYVWFGDRSNQIKLEIGSNVKPDPYTKRYIKSYIHEYLESQGLTEDIEKFELVSIELNVLNIERTFIDKLMSVKRHALYGDISVKVRHVYDVTRLFDLPEIKNFLKNSTELKRIVRLTKETDDFYFQKRGIKLTYNHDEPYDFESWKNRFSEQVKSAYEKLHIELLYTNQKQNFDKALNAFRQINKILADIGE